MSMIRHTHEGTRCELLSPTALPDATAFLYNARMLLQLNCRGYAVAQHLQPEPSKYAHAPVLEARTFMQPEAPRYAHHPGRFFYVRDDESRELFSVPYEPVRRPLDRFVFSAGLGDVRWEIGCVELDVELVVRVPADDEVELWTIEVRNASSRTRSVSIFPYFPVGYTSWMNMGATYRPELGAIVARSVTPYQKLDDYDFVRRARDLTYLAVDRLPHAWEASQRAFEGEGHLAAPEALARDDLEGGEAHFELPVCALQYRLELAPGETFRLRLAFGPARDEREIAEVRRRYLADERTVVTEPGEGALFIRTEDEDFDAFVNHWLPRQITYQGVTQRMTTDPQGRNFLQDAMGMLAIDPSRTRERLLFAMAQQRSTGAMPDGILLVPGAALKFINQVPHTDQDLWLAIAVTAYLDETGDDAFLSDAVPFADGTVATVAEHVHRSLRSLLSGRDDRGLCRIGQGDWCDPMNMVGHRGQGVSAFVSIAGIHVLRRWQEVCCRLGALSVAGAWGCAADELTAAVQRWLWRGDRFARGITDAGRVFGVAEDEEARVFLNPQAWALIAGIASVEQRAALLRAVEQELDTPFGPQLLAPPFTRMHEDIGRVTQKFPGSAENGSIYCHAATFWAYGLYAAGEADRAYSVLRSLLPSRDPVEQAQRGHLPVFLPNYYRGALQAFPRTAGRSSQLVNTGAVAWYHRCVSEGLLGLRGCTDGVRIAPQLPACFRQVDARRRMRGAELFIHYRRDPNVRGVVICVDGQVLGDGIVPLVAGTQLSIDVVIGSA